MVLPSFLIRGNLPSSSHPEVPKIESDARKQAERKDDSGKGCRQIQRRNATGESLGHELNVGLSGVVDAEGAADLHVPVRAKAVPNLALPSTHDEPGERGGEERSQVPSARLLPDPSERVEEHEDGVEGEEEDV